MPFKRLNTASMTIRVKFVREAPSGKAALLNILPSDGDKDSKSLSTRWLPHSQMETLEGDKIIGEFGTVMDIEISMWIAEKNQIDVLYKDELLDEEYEDVPF